MLNIHACYYKYTYPLLSTGVKMKSLQVTSSVVLIYYNSTGMMPDITAINGTQPMIPGTDVLEQLGVTLPFYAWNVPILLIGSGLI